MILKSGQLYLSRNGQIILIVGRHGDGQAVPGPIRSQWARWSSKTYPFYGQSNRGAWLTYRENGFFLDNGTLQGLDCVKELSHVSS